MCARHSSSGGSSTNFLPAGAQSVGGSRRMRESRLSSTNGAVHTHSSAPNDSHVRLPLPPVAKASGLPSSQSLGAGRGIDPMLEVGSCTHACSGAHAYLQLHAGRNICVMKVLSVYAREHAVCNCSLAFLQYEHVISCTGEIPSLCSLQLVSVHRQIGTATWRCGPPRPLHGMFFNVHFS
eukprot:1158505-Pelagomonas_calceolata.AAC.6